MAENRESIEGKLTTLKCMECGYREVFTERQFEFTDGFSCCVCKGPVQRTITRPGDKIRNRKMEPRNNATPFEKLTVDIDCKEALKGLKAVTREAKKATAALKELEEQQSRMNASPITTKQIGKDLDFLKLTRDTGR
jgi:NAD-dependent SIR2 family protein deacetylase